LFIEQCDNIIDLYYAATPNGHKVKLFLEEAGLAYRQVQVNLHDGDQFKPEFLAISPNNKIPAIIDHDPKDKEGPLPVFESGAILLYLAEKSGKFLPAGLRERVEINEWLFWQVGGLGPMAGQVHHFKKFATERVPYAIERYEKEVNRLYKVLDKRLEGRDFLVGEYSIADMATYPWIVPHEIHGQRLEDSPNLKAWFERISARPAVKKVYT
jgi:GST-like protein